jgi:hypothetical protein
MSWQHDGYASSHRFGKDQNPKNWMDLHTRGSLTEIVSNCVMYHHLKSLWRCTTGCTWLMLAYVYCSCEAFTQCFAFSLEARACSTLVQYQQVSDAKLSIHLLSRRLEARNWQHLIIAFVGILVVFVGLKSTLDCRIWHAAMLKDSCQSNLNSCQIVEQNLISENYRYLSVCVVRLWKTVYHMSTDIAIMVSTSWLQGICNIVAFDVQLSICLQD